ncbi:MAG: prepilin-type N-terminal cleavage/methylation domain-containing protein [Candidatus Orphnella occulta]|nr:prepilin-type N-terminal cleavage/methylation domain-containing protein [Candidatus Orphnella occulta]MDP8297485.1 prepilin-type N-terminal cleavage/methylation domain-containing protein [Candidatus Orphnella occulta]
MNNLVETPMPCIARKRDCAFTLIEILISVTIASLVAVAIYSIFTNGINAWRKGNENKAYARKLRLVSEKMTSEIRNVFEFSMIAFEGKEDFFMFPALIPQAEDRSGDMSAEYSQVGRIAYFYDNRKDAFCKEVKALPEVLNEEEIGDGEVLIEDVNGLKIGYCYLDNVSGEYKWKEDWNKEEQDTIPQALTIEISFNKDVMKNDKFSKTIFIPMGTGEQKIDMGSVTRKIEEEEE